MHTHTHTAERAAADQCVKCSELTDSEDEKPAPPALKGEFAAYGWPPWVGIEPLGGAPPLRPRPPARCRDPSGGPLKNPPSRYSLSDDFAQLVDVVEEHVVLGHGHPQLIPRFANPFLSLSVSRLLDAPPRLELESRSTPRHALRLSLVCQGQTPTPKRPFCHPVAPIL